MMIKATIKNSHTVMIVMIEYDLYVYIHTWKAIKTKFSVHTGLNMFFVRYGFFPNTAISGCKPSSYRSIVFLKVGVVATV